MTNFESESLVNEHLIILQLYLGLQFYYYCFVVIISLFFFIFSALFIISKYIFK